MKMSRSSALASLTATYTDSEAEDDDTNENENQDDNSQRTKSPSPGSKSTPNSTYSRPSSPLPVRVTAKVATLVSYAHDDTVVSDEEGYTDPSAPETQVIIMSDPEESRPEPSEPFEEDGIQIPPEPPSQCSLDLQEKILKLYEKMQTQQLDMNALIQKRKDFRNPSIYMKLIEFCGINELGTNYPPAIYDPLKWSKESYYEELAKVQKSEMEKREKERKSKVEFVSGTKKQEEDAKKRKSKWDMPGGNSSSGTQIKPAGLVQPSLTNNATGTKSTVISAFGSLPKKPRM